jgi:hypothetical protein
VVAVTSDRALTPYELEVAEAMTAHRDAAVRLKDVLAEVLSGYDGAMADVMDGRTMDVLLLPTAGQIRRGMSEAVTGFEAARHQFRLALVAVAMDHGLTARQIGDSFAFSRQLASRYLKEARAKWPELEAHALDEPHEAVVDVPDGDPRAVAADPGKWGRLT